MRHPTAHRLAQHLTHPLDEIAGHLAHCSDCQSRMARVQEVRAGMSEIASSSAPELGWDHIATRVYWSTSSARHRTERRRRRRVVHALGATTALVGAAVAAMVLWPDRSAPLRVTTPQELPQKAEAALVEPAVATPVVLRGVVTLLRGEVKGVDMADPRFSVGPGTVIETAQGAAQVQFGEESAFRVGPESSLRVARLDEERIEIHVDGVVDVDITKRPAGQTFAVVAGQHEVLVKGTAFQVEHRDGALEVRCVRGKVLVSDGNEGVAVGAGQVFSVLTRAFREAAARARPIPAEELTALEEAMYMPMLPAWQERSAVLEVQGVDEAVTAVDGLPIGAGSFLLRVAEGKHQVATVTEGALEEVEWRDSGEVVTRKPPRNRPGASRERRAELQRVLSREGRAARCLEPLAKQGLVSGSYIVFDVGLTSSGTREYLNVIDTNLSPMFQRGLREAVDRAELAEGDAASFRLRLAF